MTVFDLLGPAAVPTLICLAVGVLMLLFEMLTPGVGIPGGIGLLSLLAVVVMQIGWGSPTVAAYVVAIVLVGLLLALLFFIRSFQRGRLSRSFLVLKDSIDGTSNSAAVADKNALEGKLGIAITPLRPAGIAEFEGKRIDVATSGAFVEAGRQVRVLKAAGLQVLVEEAVGADV